MKKLGRIRTVLRRIAARGLRIHPVDSQQPAPGRAILAQPVKIDAISSPGHFLGKGINATTIRRAQGASGLINEDIYETEPRAIAASAPAQLPDKRIVEHGPVVIWMGIIENPVRVLRQTQQVNLPVRIRALLPCLETVGLRSPC